MRRVPCNLEPTYWHETAVPHRDRFPAVAVACSHGRFHIKWDSLQHMLLAYIISPRIVIEGLSLPSELKSEGFSILAKGLLGLGSQGVPSTLAHCPIWLPRPTILCKTRLWSEIVAPLSTMDSRTRTPGPITAPASMLTFGPSCKYIRLLPILISAVFFHYIPPPPVFICNEHKLRNTFE